MERPCHPTLEEIIDSALKRNGLSGTDVPTVLDLARKQELIIVFDGIDEKTVHLSPDNARDLLEQLRRALPAAATPAPEAERDASRIHKSKDLSTPAGPAGKLLLACRTHYFRDLTEEHLLTGGGRSGLKAGDFWAIHLMPFDSNQIRSYLVKALGQEEGNRAWDVIRKIHDLPGLAQTPYLLSIIAEHVKELEVQSTSGATVSAASLYELVIKEWLVRDHGKHVIPVRWKPRFMEDLAVMLWRQGVSSKDVGDLEDWVDHEVEEHLTKAYHSLISRMETDARTATFLVRDGSEYRFAHALIEPRSSHATSTRRTFGRPRSFTRLSEHRRFATATSTALALGVPRSPDATPRPGVPMPAPGRSTSPGRIRRNSRKNRSRSTSPMLPTFSRLPSRRMEKSLPRGHLMHPRGPGGRMTGRKDAGSFPSPAAGGSPCAMAAFSTAPAVRLRFLAGPLGSPGCRPSPSAPCRLSQPASRSRATRRPRRRRRSRPGRHCQRRHAAAGFLRHRWPVRHAPDEGGDRRAPRFLPGRIDSAGRRATREDFAQRGQRYDPILAANAHRSVFDYRRPLTRDGIYVMAGGGWPQMLQGMLVGPLLSRLGRRNQPFQGRKCKSVSGLRKDWPQRHSDTEDFTESGCQPKGSGESKHRVRRRGGPARPPSIPPVLSRLIGAFIIDV